MQATALPVAVFSKPTGGHAYQANLSPQLHDQASQDWRQCITVCLMSFPMMTRGMFQVMWGEQSEEAALSTVEHDNADHVSQISAMTAGSTVLDMDAPRVSDNPWSSSAVLQEVRLMSSSWQHFLVSDSWSQTVALCAG